MPHCECTELLCDSTDSELECARQLFFVFSSHTHTIVLLLFWNLSGTTRVSRYQRGKNQEGKTNLDLLEQEIVSGSGICWAICKSAPHLR